MAAPTEAEIARLLDQVCEAVEIYHVDCTRRLRTRDRWRALTGEEEISASGLVGLARAARGRLREGK